MNTVLIIIVCLLVLIIIINITGLIYFFYKRNKTIYQDEFQAYENDQQDDQLIDQNEDGINLIKNSQIIIESLRNVNHDIITLKQQVNTSSDNIKSYNDKLTTIFSNKKSRGNVGEYILNQEIELVFGIQQKGLWQTQVTLPDGGMIDAVVHCNKAKQIGIDAKFPLENFNRYREAANEIEKDYAHRQCMSDLRGHIRKVKGYISTKNNINSVILFVPSEALWNLILEDFNEIIQVGQLAKVWIVSPSTFLPLLMTIHTILGEARIGANIDIVLKGVNTIRKDIETLGNRWDEYFNRQKKLIEFGDKINTTHKKIASNSDKLFNRKDVIKIIGDTNDNATVELTNALLSEE